MLIVFTYLPGFVSMVFRGMPTVWRGRHRLIFCWLIFMQAVSPGRKTLEEMARWTPATITAWRFGRLLKAAYWNVHLIVKIPAASGGALEGRSLSCWGNLSPKPPNKDAIPPHRKQWGILASFRDLTIFTIKLGSHLATSMTRRPFNSAFHGDLNMADSIRRHVFDGHIGDVEWNLTSLAHRWTRFLGC